VFDAISVAWLNENDTSIWSIPRLICAFFLFFCCSAGDRSSGQLALNPDNAH